MILLMSNLRQICILSDTNLYLFKKYILIVYICPFSYSHILNSLIIILGKKYNYLIVFFLKREFQLIASVLMIVHYYQTKIPIDFWCRQELNSISLIQPSKIISVVRADPSTRPIRSLTKAPKWKAPQNKILKKKG